MKKQITLNVFANLWQKAKGLAFCLILLSFITVTTGAYGKTIVINEIAPSNSIITDPAGETNDWIELYNTTSSAVDISGYYLSDSPSHLKKFKFPAGTSIPGSGYLIVWADADTIGQAGLHAPFKLSSSGESLYLSNPSAQIIDNVTFGLGTGDMSYSRVTDGSETFIWQSFTYNKTNSGGVADIYTYDLNTDGIVINEYSPLNTSIADQNGEFDDWIELYNNSSSAISLVGYFLSDNPANPKLWAFPDTSIAAGGYLIVWADNDDDIGQAGLHAHFQLSGLGESLLLTNQTTVIGRTSYDIAFSNKSYARLPNGKGEYALQAPSYNVSNGGFTENLTTAGVVINEIVPVNLTVKADQEGGYDDFIELFNNSSSAVNLSNYYLSDDAANPSKWPFPSGTTISAGGYLIVWADEDIINGYGSHASFRLAAEGETILLTDGTKIIDKVTYNKAVPDSGYARITNGTGTNFYWQTATYKKTNGTTIPTSEEIVSDVPEQEFVVSHSRNNQLLTVSLGIDETKKITIYSITAAVQYSGVVNGTLSIPTSDWKNGVYLVSIGNKEKVKKVVVLK